MDKVVNCPEEDFAANNTKNLFKTVKELEDRPRKPITMVKDKHVRSTVKSTKSWNAGKSTLRPT